MAHAIANRRSRKRERLEARLTPEQKNLIARAAALRGSSVTEFVVASAQQAASETIKDFELLTLRDSARDVFVRALLNPPPPNAAARSAARRYKRRKWPGSWPVARTTLRSALNCSALIMTEPRFPAA